MGWEQDVGENVLQKRRAVERERPKKIFDFLVFGRYLYFVWESTLRLIELNLKREIFRWRKHLNTKRSMRDFEMEVQI